MLSNTSANLLKKAPIKKTPSAPLNKIKSWLIVLYETDFGPLEFLPFLSAALDIIPPNDTTYLLHLKGERKWNHNIYDKYETPNILEGEEFTVIFPNCLDIILNANYQNTSKNFFFLFFFQAQSSFFLENLFHSLIQTFWNSKRSISLEIQNSGSVIILNDTPDFELFQVMCKISTHITKVELNLLDETKEPFGIKPFKKVEEITSRQMDIFIRCLFTQTQIAFLGLSECKLGEEHLKKLKDHPFSELLLKRVKFSSKKLLELLNQRDQDFSELTIKDCKKLPSSFLSKIKSPITVQIFN